MSDTQNNQRTHALSKKSSELKHDTFIFLKDGVYVQVIASLNQKLMQADARTIYRWLHMLTSDAHSGKTEHEFDLRPISIEFSSTPFRYKRSGMGSVIPEESVVLDPGDYGWFCKGQGTSDPEPFPPFMYEPSPHSSFEKFLKHSKPTELSARLALYEIEASRKDRVKSRDQNCFFTGITAGENAKLKVAWIIPPAWAFQVDRESADPLPFQEDENAILLREKLETHWHNNEFAVDVEDDYRIVRFRELPAEIDELLPTHILSTHSDNFLRKHFDWCLRANLQAGDVSEDKGHSEIDIINFCKDMGLLYLDDDSRNPRPSPNDRRWQDSIGQEILRIEQHGLQIFGRDSSGIDDSDTDDT